MDAKTIANILTYLDLAKTAIVSISDLYNAVKERGTVEVSLENFDSVFKIDKTVLDKLKDDGIDVSKFEDVKWLDQKGIKN